MGHLGTSVLRDQALITICVLVFGSLPANAYAQSDGTREAINAYIRAVNADDPVRITSAWKALDQNQEALIFMRQNMPRLAYLFRVRGLYMQLTELQAHRSELFGGGDASGSVDRSVRALRSDLSPRAIERIEKFSVSDPDRSRRRTNQDIVLEAQGRPLLDNRSIALSNPNQNRIGNIQYIKNRLDFLYGQKFQQVPEELVPRGNTFPKSRPLLSPDIQIEGFSSKVQLVKTSPGEATFDVIMNGRVVINRLGLHDEQRTIDLYFEPGSNMLKFVHADLPARSPVTIVVIFEKATGEGRQVVLDFVPGGTREILIKASP